MTFYVVVGDDQWTRSCIVHVAFFIGSTDASVYRHVD
jgi:hypothetical protein